MGEKIYFKSLAIVHKDVGKEIHVVTDMPFLRADIEATENGRLRIIIKHESEPSQELT